MKIGRIRIPWSFCLSLRLSRCFIFHASWSRMVKCFNNLGVYDLLHQYIMHTHLMSLYVYLPLVAINVHHIVSQVQKPNFEWPKSHQRYCTMMVEKNGHFECLAPQNPTAYWKAVISKFLCRRFNFSVVTYSVPTNYKTGDGQSSSVILKFELMHAPIIGTGPELQGSLDAYAVSVHEYKIPPKTLWELHSYCPVHFDAFHAVVVDTSIHISLLKASYHTSQQKVSRDRNVSDPSCDRNFFSSSTQMLNMKHVPTIGPLIICYLLATPLLIAAPNHCILSL
ncbi:hypothetical protein VNO80_25546 [Phaseolus coccineus]|uniref:Uncharacterized protein n=1 Tax=Phaseolus coccineus TaxID=3886 RepID=A0AAN9QQ82_PHACN